MTQHKSVDAGWTKGPWRIDPPHPIWIMAGDTHVATIPRAADGDWSTANAKLIAAAPTLFDALEALLTASQPQHSLKHVFLGEAQEQARAALALARGEQQ